MTNKNNEKSYKHQSSKQIWNSEYPSINNSNNSKNDVSKLKRRGNDSGAEDNNTMTTDVKR